MQLLEVRTSASPCIWIRRALFLEGKMVPWRANSEGRNGADRSIIRRSVPTRRGTLGKMPSALMMRRRRRFPHLFDIRWMLSFLGWCGPCEIKFTPRPHFSHYSLVGSEVWMKGEVLQFPILWGFPCTVDSSLFFTIPLSPLLKRRGKVVLISGF